MEGQEWDCTISDQSLLLIINTSAVLLYFRLSPKPLSIGHQKWKWITLLVHMLLYYHQQLYCTYFTKISIIHTKHHDIRTWKRLQIGPQRTTSVLSFKNYGPYCTMQYQLLHKVVCVISSFSNSHRQLCCCSNMAASTSF